MNIFAKRINMETRSVVWGILIILCILTAVWEFMEGNMIRALLFIIIAGVAVWWARRRASAEI